VLAVVRHELPAPQLAQHLDRLFEHLAADVDRRPPRAGDMLIERLARADAQRELAVQQHTAGSRRLRDHRRMNAHRRARDCRRDGKRTHLGDRTDHRPDKRALPLLVVPRVVVVRDPQRVEAILLGQPSLFDQLARRVLLTRQEYPIRTSSPLAGRRLRSGFPPDISAKPARPWRSQRCANRCPERSGRVARRPASGSACRELLRAFR
jgi:hypothetical protein